MTQGPKDLFDCERVRALLDSYLEGQVPPPERRGMRLHIHACEECHARVLARDPLQLFAPLADEERGEAFWAGFWPAVRAGIHAADAGAASWTARFLRPALAWSAAAAMLLVTALVLMRGGRDDAARPGDPLPVARAAADGWHRVLPSAGRVGEPFPPSVEEVRSPSAKVLTMKVYGADEAVTEVVLIVDSEIEL